MIEGCIQPRYIAFFRDAVKILQFGVDLDGGTGVLPPLSFGRGQHRGNHASVVIRPDRKYGMIVLEGWRAPR
jgi:hypothetical protein